MTPPRRISLDDWDRRYAELRRAGLREPAYGGDLRRHVTEGDTRLLRLKLDNSPAALRLWNFLLSEEDRLRHARREGNILVGVLKDLGTVPVMAYALPSVVAFYPDGAWWLPCIMEHSTALLETADSLGVDDSFCPVRAMLGAFVCQSHFPIPDLLICSTGATCDDLSAIAQRLEGLGHPVFWWEIPHRRPPDAGEPSVALPGIFRAPRRQVDFVRAELERVRALLEDRTGKPLSVAALAAGIRRANRVRALLSRLRRRAFTATPAPLPALEMLIAEMLAIHFCSDQDECIAVLGALLEEVDRRIAAGIGPLRHDAVRVFWVNPIPDGVAPLEALARTALADPMAGSPLERAERICRDAARFGAEALVISRIPGASHCALEGALIGHTVRRRLGLPVVEIEVPPVADSLEPGLRTRLEALVETVRSVRLPTSMGPGGLQ